MDKKLFKPLAESMEQMDEIVRGVRAPSREICVDAVKVTGTCEGPAASHSDGPQGSHRSVGGAKANGQS